MPPSDSGDRRVEALPIVGGVRLESLRVDNLRAIRMDEPVELRRLMLVVGRNGVGKSTLARLFPLLRQSLGKRAREPLLWWDEQGVDFGSFGEALRHGAEELTLGFGFQAADDLVRLTTTLRAQETARTDHSGLMGQVPHAPTCRVRAVRVEREYGSVEFELDESGEVHRWTGRIDDDVLIQEGDAVDLVSQLDWDTALLTGQEHGVSGLGAHSTLISSLLGISRDEFDPGLLYTMRWETNGGVLSALREADLGAGFRQRVEQISRDPTSLRRLRFARLAFWGVRMLQLSHMRLRLMTARSAYVGPFREVPRRSYRPSSVEIEQLDPRGANLGMFLSALNDDERSALNAFLHNSLGFRVHVRTIGAQVELQIELDDRRYNLVDVGFGYSQVLPVVVQLWAAGRVLSFSRSAEPLATLVIEQPELHLHPHHQVLVARALAASAMEDQGPMLMIETHSDHLVGEVGLQVARGELEPERVGVLCVEPHPVAGATVRLATFDADGVLHNWPTGFLAP